MSVNRAMRLAVVSPVYLTFCYLQAAFECCILCSSVMQLLSTRNITDFSRCTFLHGRVSIINTAISYTKFQTPGAWKTKDSPGFCRDESM